MLRFTVASLLLGFVPLVACHGGGMYYTIDGTVHSGAYSWVWNDTAGSIQRTWNWKGISYPTDIGLACGDPGTPANHSYHAAMRAGSIVTVDYKSATSNNASFGHPYGPMVAYMASCPSSGCDSVDLLAPIWFKIWEVGLLSGNYVDGHWAMKEVYEGANLEIPTPKTLKPGKYLLRHEMINLQTGPVQFFPNCVQLDVSGDGNRVPEAKELVAFPGAYNEDSGTSWPPAGESSYWFYVEHAKDTEYPMPGPPVWEG